MKKRWESLAKAEKKEFIEGPGSFVNERGMRDISGNTVIYHWRDSLAGALFLTLFAAFWNGIVYSMVAVMMSGAPVKVNGIPYPSIEEAYSHHPFMLLFLIFPLIGAVLAYAALCMWVNKSTFHYDGFTLSKKTGPIPVFGGSFQLSRSSISQFYVQRTVSNSSKGSKNISYRVIALRIDGPEKEIHNASRSYQSARILEQWLEARLGIEDKPVPDEVA